MTISGGRDGNKNQTYRTDGKKLLLLWKILPLTVLISSPRSYIVRHRFLFLFSRDSPKQKDAFVLLFNRRVLGVFVKALILHTAIAHTGHQVFNKTFQTYILCRTVQNIIITHSENSWFRFVSGRNECENTI